MQEITPTPEGCKQRQELLTAAMRQLDLPLVVLTRGESVHWLTGAYYGPLMHPTAAIDSEGKVTLVAPSRKLDLPATADRKVPYEEKWLSTMRDDQRHASLQVLSQTLTEKPKRVGGEYSVFPQYLADDWACEWMDVEPTMFGLRRHKHADELAIMARANEANRRMYEAAREFVRPGITELDLFNHLHTVSVRELGEPLTYFGQDFRCNARGGSPRDRQVEAGELYILDLGVGYRGYNTDNARTLAVDGKPTDEQLAAWETIMQVFNVVQDIVAPGVSCKALFDEINKFLNAEHPPLVFNHHLGHGVGLAPHEGPHLNPNWNDSFAAGDYFTAEPGLYHESLRAGIRLEQNYVVTKTGVELLTDWPLELT